MTTPVRRQYLRLKRQYPDAILLFRLGDFYETFDDDARTAARVLEITLTSREMGKGQRVPLAGIPYHALEGYLGKLVHAGYKVAICEQLTDAAASPGLMEREVVRVVTPGTVVEPALLEQKINNYLAAILVEGEMAGLAYTDITTGEFATTQLPREELSLELERLAPAEVLVPDGHQEDIPPLQTTLTPLTAAFDPEDAPQALLDHFGVVTLEPYGCHQLPLAARAAGAIVSYLSETQKGGLGLLRSLTTYSTSAFMPLDPQTRRNLELFQSGRWGGAAHSLLSVLDITRTSMGARLLHHWLGQPLRELEPLAQRQEAVTFSYEDTLRRQEVRTLLQEVADLERLSSRIASGGAIPREVVALRLSLEVIPQLVQCLTSAPQAATIAWLTQQLKPCPDTVDLIARALVDEPGPAPGEGKVIREGFSPELDEVRAAATDAREYLASLERRERERTGIRSLKVGYNRVFGYYLEVSKTNLSQVPPEYARRQTLVGGERFITPELKEYEARILHARERLEELEQTLYRQVCRQVGEAAPRIAATAAAVAQVDVLASLAEVAVRYGYVRPLLDTGETIHIIEGRHPVVERALPPGSFVANDIHLDNSDVQLVVLTGPNMSGKSTYLRQVALIVLLAQIGSYVPAREATVGLVDRVFTRVGLQDDLVTGQSTFMVEMVETASILHHATPRSLVILDEIGRGTSTYDGLAIAQAVAEYLHSHPRLGCKTLFATHYHEMADLGSSLPRARNFNVAVMEEEGRVVFLHRILPGAADRSYGVHVAQLAGLPAAVIHRAGEALQDLERQGEMQRSNKRRSGRPAPPPQLPLFGTPSPLMQELLSLDISSMTPLEALNRLYQLQQQGRQETPEA